MSEFPKVTKIPNGVILQGAPHPDDWDKYRPGDSFRAHDENKPLGHLVIEMVPFPVEELQRALAKLKAHRETETDAEFTKRLYPDGMPAEVAEGLARLDANAEVP